MLDIIGALALSGVFVALVVALTNGATVDARARITAYAVAGIWATFVTTLAAFGRFDPASSGIVLQPPVIFAAWLGILLTIWFASPKFRTALLSIPLPTVVGVHTMRVLGVFFLVLLGEHRLIAPFAPSAGWGDIITGIGAAYIAIVLARGGRVSTPLLAGWNVFGTLDLIAALTFAALSVPNTPIYMFTEQPGLAAMTQLPWLLVPTVFVPIYLLSHLAIFTRLWQTRVAREQYAT